MGEHKIKIDENFSIEGCVISLSEMMEPRNSPTLISVEMEFNDAVALIKGTLRGYFSGEKLSDVSFKIEYVSVKYNVKEVEKLVKGLILK